MASEFQSPWTFEFRLADGLRRRMNREISIWRRRKRYCRNLAIVFFQDSRGAQVSMPGYAGSAGDASARRRKARRRWRRDIARWSSRFPRLFLWPIWIAALAKLMSVRRLRRRSDSRRRNGLRIRCAGTSRFIRTISSAGALKPRRCFLPASRCVRPIGFMRATATSCGSSAKRRWCVGRMDGPGSCKALHLM